MIGRHFIGLDVLRFVAALLVASFHFTWHNPGAPFVVSIGWIGVEIFFVISGIVIALSAQGSTAARFARSRILRLYPAAFLAAVLNFTLLKLWSPQAYADLGLAVGASSFRALASLLLIGPGFLASSYWTLPIEIAFYGLVWLLLLARQRAPLRALAVALTLASLPYLVVIAIDRLGVVAWPFIEMGYGPRNMLLLRHAPYFAMGIYIWYASVRSLRAIDWVLVALALLASLGHIVLRAVELAPTYTVPQNLTGLAISCCGVFVGAVVFAALVVRMQDGLAPGPRVQRASRMLGLATYPLYLLHEVLGGFIASIFLRAGGTMLPALIFAMLGVVAFSLCIALWWEPVVRRGLDGVLARCRSRLEAFRIRQAIRRPPETETLEPDAANYRVSPSSA